MAKAKFDIKTEATRSLYAYAGVADLAVETVRDYVADVQAKLADVQQDVTSRVADVQKNATDPKALREQAVTVVNARVDALTKDARARRQAVESRVADLQAEAKTYPAKLQALVNGNVATANDAYDDLVKRGESLVGRIRRQESTQATVKSAKTTTAKAKTTKTQATKATKSTATAGKKKSAAGRSSAKATATAAKKTAGNATDAVTDAASKIGD